MVSFGVMLLGAIAGLVITLLIALMIPRPTAWLIIGGTVFGGFIALSGVGRTDQDGSRGRQTLCYLLSWGLLQYPWGGKERSMRKLLTSTLVLGLLVAGCSGHAGGDKASADAPTTATTTAVTLPPSPPTTKDPHPRLYNFVPRQKGGIDVDQALALIRRLDPRVLRKNADLPWTITLCATDCANPLELGETNPGLCYTSLEIDRIRRTAPQIGIPYHYLLAVVMVHEYQHCFTEDDERASVRAELAFEATWPNRTYRVRAERVSRRAFSYIDAEGHWRD